MRAAVPSLSAVLLLSCAPAMTDTQPQPAIDEPDGAAAVAEVEELHSFFVRWFRADVPDSDAEFDRFSSALAAEFEMVVPSGARLGRDAVLAGVRGGHGQWREDEGATIEVREATAHGLGGGLVRVSYEEWQRGAGEWKARRSTALLRGAGDGRLEWVHVHETWISD